MSAVLECTAIMQCWSAMVECSGIVAIIKSYCLVHSSLTARASDVMESHKSHQTKPTTFPASSHVSFLSLKYIILEGKFCLLVTFRTRWGSPVQAPKTVKIHPLKTHHITWL